MTRDRISHSSGGEFIFRGLSRNIESVKSLFCVDVVWIEECGLSICAAYILR